MIDIFCFNKETKGSVGESYTTTKEHPEETLGFELNIFLCSHSSKMNCLISFILEGERLFCLNQELISIG